MPAPDTDPSKNTTDHNADHDAAYEADVARAHADGTALPEITDGSDLPPADLYHGAEALAQILADDLPENWQNIGLADTDPARWESLDVARAAAFAVRNRRAAFDALLERFPWLAAYGSGHSADPLGAMADQFLTG